jgi:hypothetical protein
MKFKNGECVTDKMANGAGGLIPETGIVAGKHPLKPRAYMLTDGRMRYANQLRKRRPSKPSRSIKFGSLESGGGKMDSVKIKVGTIWQRDEKSPYGLPGRAQVRVMAVVEGYVMFRRWGAMPNLKLVRDFLHEFTEIQ